MKVCSLYCRKKFKTRVSGLICNFSVFGFQTLDVAVLNYLFILNSFYFFPKFFFHFFPIYERKSIGSRQGSSRSLIIYARNLKFCIFLFTIEQSSLLATQYMGLVFMLLPQTNAKLAQTQWFATMLHNLKNSLTKLYNKKKKHRCRRTLVNFLVA